MILEQELKIKCSSRNLKDLRKKYEDIKIGDEVKINIKELSLGSNKKIKVQCCNCKTIKEITYYDYNKITKNNTEEYYCSKCKNIKIKNTVNEKYGVDNVFQLDNIKDKIKKTNVEKYGVEHHLQNKDILQKQIDTNLQKYGVEYLMQNKDILQKQINTNFERYGEKCSLLNDEVKSKSKNTIKDKYGVEYIMQNKDIVDKSLKSKNKKIYDKYKEYNILNIDKNIYTIECEKGHIYNITSELFRNRIKQKTIICTECNPINSYSISGLQLQLNNYIKSLVDTTIEYGNRKIISPYELDIFLPEYNIALEFNGVYWHNELNKHNNYHKNKSDMCDKLGIQLIHVWEDDWLYKQEIVKSIIKNTLHKNDNIIYARKCEIKEITDNIIVKNFLNENHIQGYIQSKIKIGLYYDNELVSLMTFGKSRKPLGGSGDETWELIRFCNKLNTNIIGGANRLFQYFIKTYKSKQIISYCDRCYFKGNIYEKLGFKYEKTTKINHYYVVDGIRKYRYNYRKDILVKEGYDKNKSEHEIMLDRQIYRVYDSGNFKYTFIN